VRYFNSAGTKCQEKFEKKLKLLSKWDFGKDTGLVLKIISLIERYPEARYEILAYFLEFLDKHGE
jgi:hypothetical protein